MSNMKSICRPHPLISSFISCCRSQARLGFTSSFRSPRLRLSSINSSSFLADDLPKMATTSSRFNSRRTLTRVSNWNSEKSPYETLGGRSISWNLGFIAEFMIKSLFFSVEFGLQSWKGMLMRRK